MTVDGVGGKPRKYNDDGSKFIPEPKPKVKLSVEDIEPDYTIRSIEREPEKEVKMTTNKIGTFIVVNPSGLNGLRINVERISSYSPNSEKSIGIAWDNSTQGTTLKFNTPGEMLKVLEQMDAVCL